jgi:hypothetical protein
VPATTTAASDGGEGQAQIVPVCCRWPGKQMNDDVVNCDYLLTQQSRKWITNSWHAITEQNSS